MEILFNPLIITAISLGFIHTILGPDHYLPFVALSKSNNWSYRKTILISAVCGMAHCLSSVLIGIFGIGFGVIIGQIESIESVRGDLASYIMISFGIVYFIWSIKRLMKNQKHNHTHDHGNVVHSHSHNHNGNHVHNHKNVTSNLFWGIFIVFLFGPCEPLIPILMYPAAKANLFILIMVTLAFTLTTIFTMLAAITFSLKGLSFISLPKLEKYSHAISSLTIIICGLLIVIGL